MEIHILDQIIKTENQDQKIFECINTILTKNNLFVDYLLIDENVIYENFEKYLEENIEDIQIIKVVTITLKKLLSKSFESIKLYIDRAKPEINKIVEQFYSGPTRDSWDKFSLLVEGLQWIIQILDAQGNHIENEKVRNNLIHEKELITGELTNLLGAVETKDMVLIADIIQYEIIPIIERIEVLIIDKYQPSENGLN
ncbi:hypothetical protein ACFSCX_09460 [Bacillus salitolerans]|uniref:Uncharacterized protein n=1 Tax=Bacillus salitolerans TaxID=1437434 RepID=A0ABW4LPT2_9BACI